MVHHEITMNAMPAEELLIPFVQSVLMLKAIVLPAKVTVMSPISTRVIVVGVD